jgi:small GTP-binding protein
MRSWRLAVVLALVVIALVAGAVLVGSIGELHDRLARHSGALATGFLVVALVLAAGAVTVLLRLTWKLGRAAPSPVQAPQDVIQAAEVQAEKAQEVIAQIEDEQARGRLNEELATLRGDYKQRRFHVVVFGTGAAGKTALINALLGRHAGKTEPVMGTTRRGEQHTQVLEGIEGTVLLTDTPGLAEVGSAGALREAEARDLAVSADLLLFVVDHDLTRSEFEPLVALIRQGKRSIVVLNKQDRFTEADRNAILDRLRERLRDLVPAKDVVAVAAAPRPMPVRVVGPEGDAQTVSEPRPPDIAELQRRIAAILQREGDALRAGNLLLRAHKISTLAQDQRTQERDRRAQAVIDKFQWITASTVFANPVPALDLLANGAVQFQMLSELADVYGVEISAAHLKMIGMQLVQTLLKLGMVEAAASLIAGLFKSSLVGFAAGGALQGVTMAYLTHVSGHACAEYFARGQSWGDGGMQAALIRQFDLNRRADFLQEFARQALVKVAGTVWHEKEQPAGKPS